MSIFPPFQVLCSLPTPQSGPHLDQEQGGAGVLHLVAPLDSPDLAHARHRWVPWWPRGPDVQHQCGPTVDQGLLPVYYHPLLLAAAVRTGCVVRNHRQSPDGQCPGVPARGEHHDPLQPLPATHTVRARSSDQGKTTNRDHARNCGPLLLRLSPAI